MKVKVLRQFLSNLVEPLRASQASAQQVADLERMNAGLDPFAEKSVQEFADFLDRARDYEQQGHWPEKRPPISGLVVDDPTIEVYADRLKTFLKAEVPATGPMPMTVAEELNRLTGKLKLPQLKELAKAVGVTDTVGTGQKAKEKIFLQITGRNLGEAVIEAQAETVRQWANEPNLEARLEQLFKSINLTQIKQLAKTLNIKEKITKTDAVKKFRQQLQPTSIPQESKNDSTQESLFPSSSDSKINRIVETLKTLKAKAELENPLYEEIEAELNQLEGELSKDEALEVAQKFGVPWDVTTKTEALEKIRRRVLDMKRARERIEY